MTTTTNNNVTNYFGLTADDVIKFEQEHSFKYYLCDAGYDEDTNEAYIAIMFFGTSTAKHDQFILTSDEVNKYYEMHEHNDELVRAYEDYKKYVNKAA